jgi:protein phosphatase
MVEAFGASDSGCVRANNEDSFLVAPDAGLYLVADGMGGALAGEHASRMVADTLHRLLRESPSNGSGVDAGALEGMIRHANDSVKAAAEANPERKGMGTTLVAVVERGDRLLVASVGDSRVYKVENGRLAAVTEDQSWVNEVGRKLGFDEETLRTHPMRHVLTMAIGVSEQLRINSYQLSLKPGMQVLLSSDGLHGVVPEEAIESVLAGSGTLEEKCAQLIAAARELGAPDNVTTVLLRVT